MSVKLRTIKGEKVAPLTISGIPLDLKADIQTLADYNRRSLSSQIVELLYEIVAMRVYERRIARRDSVVEVKKAMKAGVFA